MEVKLRGVRVHPWNRKGHKEVPHSILEHFIHSYTHSFHICVRCKKIVPDTMFIYSETLVNDRDTALAFVGINTSGRRSFGQDAVHPIAIDIQALLKQFLVFHALGTRR